MTGFKFIDDHQTEHSVKRMCRVINMQRSSYYTWKATQHARAAKTQSDALLRSRIMTAFEEEKGLYGAQRITAAGNAESSVHRVNHKRVARIMKTLGVRRIDEKNGE